MCGKLFRASILKHAIEYIPAQSLTLAEDACICFVATYFAQSYKGLPE
ncbi:MAG: glycosyltransferase family 2 protein, partial [Subdoligranulum sp.]|nr:glycosyltransferase family 2 protein [Subdoligranulum sp.]